MKSYFGAWKIVFFCRPQRMYFLRKTLRENIEFHAFYGHFILAPRCNTTIVKNVFRNVKKKNQEKTLDVHLEIVQTKCFAEKVFCAMSRKEKSPTKRYLRASKFSFLHSPQILSLFFKTLSANIEYLDIRPHIFFRTFRHFKKAFFGR